MTNDTTNESSLTCLLVLADMEASKLENNDNLMKLLALAQADASKLEDENDKLRKDVIDLDVCYQILCDGHARDFSLYVQIDVENDKLRKLVKDMWDWLAPTAMRSGAPVKELSDRMRKLRIEVETDEDW